MAVLNSRAQGVLRLMKKDYMMPVVLFFMVLAIGLSGHSAYRWWSARWQRKIAEEALRQLHIAIEERFLRASYYPVALDAQGKGTGYGGGYTLGLAPWTLLPAKKIPERVHEKAKQVHYCSDGMRNWILAHPGPGGQVDTDLVGWIRDASGSLELYRRLHPEGLVAYDPTNGAMSRGDILRTGP